MEQLTAPGKLFFLPEGQLQADVGKRPPVNFSQRPISLCVGTGEADLGLHLETAFHCPSACHFWSSWEKNMLFTDVSLIATMSGDFH